VDPSSDLDVVAKKPCPLLPGIEHQSSSR